MALVRAVICWFFSGERMDVGDRIMVDSSTLRVAVRVYEKLVC